MCRPVTRSVYLHIALLDELLAELFNSENDALFCLDTLVNNY